MERIEGLEEALGWRCDTEMYTTKQINRNKSLDEDLFLMEDFLTLCFRVKESIKTEEKDDNNGRKSIKT